MDLMSLDKAYIAGTYARFPVAITEGKGAILKDINGKEYIDFGSGIAVNTFGAGDEQWVKAVSEQAARLAHTSNLYYTEPQVLLAQMLCERTGMKRVFFGNSGAEANECAIKVARKYAAKKGKTECNVIVSLEGSFHGRTLATLAMTGQDVFHTQFLPLPTGFASVAPNDQNALDKALNENVCALIIEVVQGEGGVNPIDKAYAQYAQALCAQRDILLIVDEVQTGIGRTGTLFAYTQYNLQPDVVTSAKGLGGGLPIGACLMGERVKDVFTYSDHGSTFGGNPICASGAVSILTRLDEAFLSDLRQKADYLKQTLESSLGIKSISGMGFMLGLETEKPAAEVVASCWEAGLLVLTAKHKVRLLPPLNIETNILKKGLDILQKSL